MGHESHEGQKHEGHEGKEGQCHCQGQDGQGSRLQWQKAEDPEWYDQGKFGQKQEWQDCVQKSLRASKEGLCKQRSQAWCDAIKAARKAFNLTGFVAIGGKSATGKALYAKAKSLLK